MAAQAMHDGGGGAASAEQPRTSFGRLTDIGPIQQYQLTSNVYEIIINYIDEFHIGYSNLDFIKTYLGSLPHTWETLATASMMCIFEKYPFEDDSTLHLYPGSISVFHKFIQMWKTLNNLITEDIFSYKEVALMLSKIILIKNELGRTIRPHIQICPMDPIIMRITHDYDTILPTTLTEFHTFISSNCIQFDYRKFYLKLCRMHMAVQTINRYWRLVTCNPDYNLGKKRLLQIYHD